MTGELANPLKGLLAQAAKRLPTDTGDSARYRARLENAGTSTVLVCDTSGSMSESAGARGKIDHLREAIDSVWGTLAEGRLIAFDSTPRDLASPGALPSPSGGTALHLALKAAAAHRPRRTIVISDGQPDSEDDALAAAERLTGTIDVIYCGPDGDLKAIAFMRKLARIGAGAVIIRDIVRLRTNQLGPALRQVLSLPRPK